MTGPEYRKLDRKSSVKVTILHTAYNIKLPNSVCTIAQALELGLGSHCKNTVWVLAFYLQFLPFFK